MNLSDRLNIFLLHYKRALCNLFLPELGKELENEEEILQMEIEWGELLSEIRELENKGCEAI